MMSAMADDPRSRLVAQGYDAITDRYRSWSAAIDDPHRQAWLERFLDGLPDGGQVLELGCGQGGPTTAAIADRFGLVGVDASVRQIEQARAAVPAGTFLVGDMQRVEFEPERFDGVIACYSIIHVPRDGHLALFRRIATWLRPGGWFLASLSAEDDPGWTGEWLGVPMFFSGFDADTNLRLLDDAGLAVVAHEIATIREPEGDARFQWVLARRD
jgi:SAM-dependent methyltransferase